MAIKNRDIDYNGQIAASRCAFLPSRPPSHSERENQKLQRSGISSWPDEKTRYHFQRIHTLGTQQTSIRYQRNYHSLIYHSHLN